MQDETPAPASRVTDVLQFPGANLKGSNAGGFPTVWAPFRSGWVFRTSDYAGKPGTVLHFSNVTLALPGETYAGVASSGFLDYLDLGTNSHVCFTNRYGPQQCFPSGNCKICVPYPYGTWTVHAVITIVQL